MLPQPCTQLGNTLQLLCGEGRGCKPGLPKSFRFTPGARTLATASAMGTEVTLDPCSNSQSNPTTTATSVAGETGQLAQGCSHHLSSAGAYEILAQHWE